MALVIAFLMAEIKNRPLEDLLQADFCRVPERFLLSVRTNSKTDNFVYWELGPLFVFVVIQRMFSSWVHQRTLRFFLGICQSFNFHSLLESTFLVNKGPLCLYDEQNNTWLLVGMKFLFSCSTQCLTRSRHLKTLTSSFRGDVSPWFGYQDGQILMLS